MARGNEVFPSLAASDRNHSAGAVHAGRVRGKSYRPRQKIIARKSYIMKRLTPRQMAICQMIADGRQNKEIAQQEDKSIVSVKRQIEAIMAATGTLNRAHLAAWYVRQTEVRQ